MQLLGPKISHGLGHLLAAVISARVGNFFVG